jgi:iron complex transport system permease protein
VATLGIRPAPSVASRRVGLLWGLVAVAVLVGALLTGVLVGPVHIGVGEIGRSLLAHLGLADESQVVDRTHDAIVWDIRLPRVVLGALVGGMLGLAGASYQGVFRNPLADPYLLGVAAGAGFGATLMIAYGPHAAAQSTWLPITAFAGAVVAVIGAYAIGRSVGGGHGTSTLILAGVTVAAFLSAAQTFVQQQQSQSINEIYAWLLGGLDTSGWSEVGAVAPYVAVSSVVLLLHRRALDVLAVGDEEARTLGLDVTRTRLLVIAAATLGTAAVVAVSGLIGFVGIVVPHLIRLVVASSFRVIVPLSLAVGAAFLVFADVLARTVLAPAEVPIGVVTAFVGAPFFAFVLRTARTARL